MSVWIRVEGGGELVWRMNEGLDRGLKGEEIGLVYIWVG
jgi:hypothetical protein